MLVATAFGILALVACGVYLYRMRSYGARRGTKLDDDLIRRIEETGRVEVEEPLDMDEIRDEEERFWGDQPWDEPEEW